MNWVDIGSLVLFSLILFWIAFETIRNKEEIEREKVAKLNY